MSLNHLARDSSAAAHQLYIVRKFVFKAEKATKQKICQLQNFLEKAKIWNAALVIFDVMYTVKW